MKMGSEDLNDSKRYLLPKCSPRGGSSEIYIVEQLGGTEAITMIGSLLICISIG